MKATEYTLVLLAMFALLACGGTATITLPADGDSSEMAEGENEADGDGESAEAAEPGTECAPEAAHRCADPYTLYTCTGSVWVLAATCTESGKQCQDGECKTPETPCKNGERTCIGTAIAECNELGAFVKYNDCANSSSKTCSFITCKSGQVVAGCFVEGDSCE